MIDYWYNPYYKYDIHDWCAPRALDLKIMTIGARQTEQSTKRLIVVVNSDSNTTISSVLDDALYIHGNTQFINSTFQ